MVETIQEKEVRRTVRFSPEFFRAVRKAMVDRDLRSVQVVVIQALDHWIKSPPPRIGDKAPAKLTHGGVANGGFSVDTSNIALHKRLEELLWRKHDPIKDAVIMLLNAPDSGGSSENGSDGSEISAAGDQAGGGKAAGDKRRKS